MFHVPVIETGAGICHTYFDKDGDTNKGREIVTNGKTRRVSVCNALDCLIIHKDRIGDLPEICRLLQEKNVIIYADEPAYNALADHYPEQLLKHATEESFGHAHCPFSSGKIAMQIAQKQHIPLVATFHSKYEMDFAHLIPNKYLLRHIVQNIIDFYEAADEVWIPQSAVEETLREYGYKGKVEVVENGSDFGPQMELVRSKARSELGIPSNENIFLFVGQHIWEKNISFLLHGRFLPCHVALTAGASSDDRLQEAVASAKHAGQVRAPCRNAARFSRDFRGQACRVRSPQSSQSRAVN